MIKAVIFDLDNTLYSEMDYVEGAYKNIANYIAKKKNLPHENYILERMLHYRRETDTNVINRIMVDYGIEDDKLQDIIKIYHESDANISLYKDVCNFFNSDRNIKYGVLTNGSLNTQENKLEQLGIKDWFQYITITGKHFEKEEWKPNHKPFEYTLKKLGVKASECLFVGDSFENDVIGSLNMGMHSLQIDRSLTNGIYKNLYKHNIYWKCNSFKYIDKIIHLINMEFKPDINIVQLENRYKSNDIYVLREDLLPFSFGGNKLRKAEYFFKEIKQYNYDYIVTYGSSSSNHTRIVANKARQLGLPCMIITPKENYIDTSNSLLISELDVKLKKVEINKVKEKIEEVMSDLKSKGKKPYFIEGGGHGILGTQAYVDAYDSIASYEYQKSIKFDYIFLASGTGSTQAGLICGSIMTGIDKQIIGISIARKNPYGKDIIRSSIQDYLNYMDITSPMLKEINFIDDYVFGGYAQHNKKIDQIIMDMFCYEGISLDRTYTGKGYFGMKDYIKINEIKNKNILFIHTGGTPLFFDDIKELNND